jgi:hypothetical protein
VQQQQYGRRALAWKDRQKGRSAGWRFGARTGSDQRYYWRDGTVTAFSAREDATEEIRRWRVAGVAERAPYGIARVCFHRAPRPSGYSAFSFARAPSYNAHLASNDLRYPGSLLAMPLGGCRRRDESSRSIQAAISGSGHGLLSRRCWHHDQSAPDSRRLAAPLKSAGAVQSPMWANSAHLRQMRESPEQCLSALWAREQTSGAL